MDLDPLCSVVPGGPGIQSVRGEVTHPRGQPLVPESQLTAENVVDLVRTVPVRLHPLTRFGRLVVHAQTVRLDQSAGDEVSPKHLEELFGARDAGQHLLVGQTGDSCHIENKWMRSVGHLRSVPQRSPNWLNAARRGKDLDSDADEGRHQDEVWPPEVVGVTDVRSPVPEADEVLTRVTDTTVNRTECGLRVGRPS